MVNPLRYREPQNGRFYKEDGTPVNIADMAEAIYNAIIVKKNIGGSKAVGSIVVTPSDSTVLETTSGLYLGTSGDVAVTMKDGTNVIFKSLAAGVVHPICVTKVKPSGTTATNILAVY